MIRQTWQKEMVERDIVFDQTIICNKCGLEIRTVVRGEIQPDEFGFFHEVVLGGKFGDDVVGDLNNIVIHLCLPCVEALLDSMSVAPMVDSGIHEASWTEWQENGRTWIGMRSERDE